MNALGIVEGVVVDCDIVEGGALSHNNHLVDIYSNSWGPPDTGYLAQGPGTLARMALEMGVKEVGLSSIYQVLLYHFFQFCVTVRQIAGSDLWSIQVAKFR